MKNLAQKAFEIIPDCIKVRVFELSDEENFFLEVVKEKKIKIREYICSEEENRSQVIECKYIMKTMRFLLDRYGKDGRFYEYFSEQAELLGQDLGYLLRYH